MEGAGICCSRSASERSSKVMPFDFIINDLSLETLFQAIESGNEKFVTAMLQRDPGLIENVDVDEWGPIHACARVGNNKILKILVETFKADVNQKTAYGKTPMHIAAENGKIETLLELKKLGADISIENRGDENVIDILRDHHIVIPRHLFQQIFEGSEDLSEDFSITVSARIAGRRGVWLGRSAPVFDRCT